MVTDDRTTLPVARYKMLEAHGWAEMRLIGRGAQGTVHLVRLRDVPMKRKIVRQSALTATNEGKGSFCVSRAQVRRIHEPDAPYCVSKTLVLDLGEKERVRFAAHRICKARAFDDDLQASPTTVSMCGIP